MSDKIGILTYHTGYNYGASLQNYALQTVVKKLGYDVETINFETYEFLANREMFSRKPRRAKELIKLISRLPYRKVLLKRQYMFDKYTKECLLISDLYRDEKEVVDNAGKYGCIICGSDQIWNVSKEAAEAANYLYFLNFEKKQRRVAYAASFGGWINEAPKYEREFVPWLEKFDAISVREKCGVEYVKSLGINCELCLDPTLLIDSEDYDSICADRLIDEKYILMFGWNTNKDLVEAAKIASKKLHLPVYNIVPPPRGIGSGIRRKLDVGPREFLSMVKYAEFVVTNSFHGTAFSIVLEKPFVSVISKGKADLRMKSLIEQLEMNDNLASVNNFNFDRAMEIDYSKVKRKIVKLRKSSLDFLSMALEGLDKL